MGRIKGVICCLFLLVGHSALAKDLKMNLNQGESKRITTIKELCGKFHMNNGSPYLVTGDNNQIWFFKDDESFRHQGFLTVLAHYARWAERHAYYRRNGIPSERRWLCFEKAKVTDSEVGRQILSGWYGEPNLKYDY